MPPPTNREKNNRKVRDQIDKIEALEEQLDEREGELGLMRPTTPEQVTRQQELRDAIAKKRASLARQKHLLEQFLASNDGDERMELFDNYKEEKAEFSSTESFADKINEVCVPCQFGLGRYKTRWKTVWAEIIDITFDGDHKLLRPDPGDFKDQSNAPFSPPHWKPEHSHPVSYTKNTNLKLTARFLFYVESDPPGQTASWTKIKGIAAVRSHSTGAWLGRESLNFEGAPTSGSVKSGVYASKKLSSAGKLSDWVWDYRLRLRWFVQAEGKWLAAGQSEHEIFALYGAPRGRMGGAFTETGPVQSVTVERMRLAVVAARTKWTLQSDGSMSNDGFRHSRTERHCVDAVFWDLKGRDVSYSLGRRWKAPPAVNETGITPRPTLHHYLWRTMAATALGECHNIAGAFVLMCRILGVSGAMEVGYMYPRPGRSDTPPAYGWAGGDVGAWNARHSRAHALAGHGTEQLYFIDANRFGNNFEGATKYGGKYYAIGEGIYESASHFYGYKHTDGLWYGSFDISFTGCSTPYPNHYHSVVEADPESGATWTVAGFEWHDGR